MVLILEDYLCFVDEALDAMVAIVEKLGDQRANLRPDVSGANTPYAILTHCLGVMDYWGGHVVAGRLVERDREAEFHAEGAVADLVERARSARHRLDQDLSGCQPLAPTKGRLRPGDGVRPRGRTQGGALMHLYEELAQHLGQMQVCRDLILTPGFDRASRA